MGLEHEATHAARLGEVDGLDDVERADHAARPRRIGIDMEVDVDRADQRRIDEAEIDRPAQRIDLPLLAGVLGAARGGGECEHRTGEQHAGQ